MLTAFDDYLIHQTPERSPTPDRRPELLRPPLLQRLLARGRPLLRRRPRPLPEPARDGRGFHRDPRRRQQSCTPRVSRPPSRGETSVGPIAIEVVEALRTLRVRVAPNDFGLEADLLFRARGPALEEPRFTARVENRLFMDTTRLTQFGLWEGTITAGGTRLMFAPCAPSGARPLVGRAPVGEPEGSAPGLPPQFFWLWPRSTSTTVHALRRQRGRGGAAVARRRQRAPPRRRRRRAGGHRRAPRALAAGHAPGRPRRRSS